MIRRRFLKNIIAIPVLSNSEIRNSLANISAPAIPLFKRVRPQDAGWPSAESWNQLSMQVGGRLRKLESPFASCDSNANSAACIEAIKEIKNPYYTGDQPALSQSSGYFKAWNAAPSTYVVEAISAADVVAAVNFARGK
jgi:hypothetical protein